MLMNAEQKTFCFRTLVSMLAFLAVFILSVNFETQIIEAATESTVSVQVAAKTLNEEMKKQNPEIHIQIPRYAWEQDKSGKSPFEYVDDCTLSTVFGYTTQSKINEQDQNVVDMIYTIDYCKFDRKYVDKCVKNICDCFPNGSDRFKFYNIYKYITSNIDYDYDLLGIEDKEEYYKEYKIRSTAYAGWKTGKTICLGYSQMVYLLCEKAKIPCHIVVGSTSGGGYHAWNDVEISGIWFHVDATWDADITRKDRDVLPQDEWNYYLVGNAEFADHNAQYLGWRGAIYKEPVNMAASANARKKLKISSVSIKNKEMTIQLANIDPKSNGYEVRFSKKKSVVNKLGETNNSFYIHEKNKSKFTIDLSEQLKKGSKYYIRVLPVQNQNDGCFELGEASNIVKATAK